MAPRAQAAENGVIRQMTRALGKGSQATVLASLLYGRKGPDGLAAASSDWLTGNVREALAFIAEMPKGRHKIRLRHEPAGRRSEEASVLEILNDDMPIIYLGHQPYAYAISNKVKGFAPSPDGMMRLLGVSKD